ncbi:Mobile element protein [Desulfovibrio sp. TomC]|nr:Mobile element protein [Desulfovibrio sp. TomC]
MCKPHDYQEFTWRHLNFFQHYCYLTARVPRVDCPDHGTRRVTVLWARPGSSFTLLFEHYNEQRPDIAFDVHGPIGVYGEDRKVA